MTSSILNTKNSEDDASPLQAVLDIIAKIPPGNVSTYGEVGKAASAGPRYVGWALRNHGDALPWWRVVRANGASHDIERARKHWEAEGITMRPRGDKKSNAVDLSKHGLDAEDLKAL